MDKYVVIWDDIREDDSGLVIIEAKDYEDGCCYVRQEECNVGRGKFRLQPYPSEKLIDALQEEISYYRTCLKKNAQQSVVREALGFLTDLEQGMDLESPRVKHRKKMLIDRLEECLSQPAGQPRPAGDA